MSVQVKICGVTDPHALSAALEGGARYIGLVFYPRSPRCVSPAMAAELSRMITTGVRTVGLFVNPTDETLDHVIGQAPLDLLQLHGDETPERVAEIRSRFHIPIMKAFRIGGPEDFAPVASYADVVERFLFDAKPPATPNALPGGNGARFDWGLLKDRVWPRPWLLAGGLNAESLPEAVAVSGARAVDVSSGVEDSPGRKSPALIRAFLERAARLA